MDDSVIFFPAYYAIIPASIRYDKTIGANEKLLYSEITALASKNGFCWAQNKYFAELYAVETRTIRRWLAKLAKKGHIKIKIKKRNCRYIKILTIVE